MCGFGCRVRVICYGGLRWTPWTPWGSWLWPVRPVDSPPALRPTPHPPPSQQSITTPPSPCPAAGAARTATGASDTSAGVNVEKQMEQLTTWMCVDKVVCYFFGRTELMKDGDDWPALMLSSWILVDVQKETCSEMEHAERGTNRKYDCIHLHERDLQEGIRSNIYIFWFSAESLFFFGKSTNTPKMTTLCVIN